MLLYLGVTFQLYLLVSSTPSCRIIDSSNGLQTYVTEVRRSWKCLQVDEIHSALQNSLLCDMKFIESLDTDQLTSIYDSIISCILDWLVLLHMVTIRKPQSDP